MSGIGGVMTTRRWKPGAPLRDRFERAFGAGSNWHRAPGLAMVCLPPPAPAEEPPRESGGSAVAVEAGVSAAAARDIAWTAEEFYRHRGLDFTAMLRGSFAAALHDAEADRLVLARDAFGVRPLYYVERHNYFAFASRPRALLAAGMAPRELAQAPLGEFLQRGFSSGRDSVYSHVKRVLPGESAAVSSCRIVERRRRAALPDGGPRKQKPAAALAELDRLLKDTVSACRSGGGACGIFLSESASSGVLLAAAARESARRLRAWTVRLPSAAGKSRAAAAAQALGVAHTEITFDQAQFWRSLPEIAALLDDPCADPVLTVHHALAAAASGEVETVLSVVGARELFAARQQYLSTARPAWLGGRMNPPGIFSGLGVLRAAPSSPWDHADPEGGADLAGHDRLQAAQAADIDRPLAFAQLPGRDRCLAAHGLNFQAPFLDRDLAQFAFRLPRELKMARRPRERLLNRWLAQAAPKLPAWGENGQAATPIAEWIAARGAELGPLVAAQPGIGELCRPGAVAPLFVQRGRRAAAAAWTLLFYALWHRAHVLTLPMEGDCLEVLADSAVRHAA